ncbi:hypothetical protein V8G54_001553 [Vigna mungo]|uniref:Uncharacterized protein n=1 Tax=Vigna mungo TaxID=3915 RepID=A0AAQ3P820_VIGMU
MGVVSLDKNVKRVGKEFQTWEATMVLHSLKEPDNIIHKVSAKEGHQKRVVGSNIVLVPANLSHHITKRDLGFSSIAFLLPPFEKNGKGVAIRRHLRLDALEKLDAHGCLVVLTANGAEERVNGHHVLLDAVPVHDVEAHDGLVKPTGGGVAMEYGSEGGERKFLFLFHGPDGVPHGLEKLVFTQQVDHQVPGMSRVLFASPGPPEELDGGGRVIVGEFQDLFDEVLLGIDSRGGEGGFDVVRGGACEDVTKGTSGRRYVGRVEVGGELVGFGNWGRLRFVRVYGCVL